MATVVLGFHLNALQMNNDPLVVNTDLLYLAHITLWNDADDIIYIWLPNIHNRAVIRQSLGNFQSKIKTAQKNCCI